MATRMQQRRGTASQWTSADPILAAGEIGFESDTNQFKIGDGVNHWSDLSYFKNLEDLGGSLDDYLLANSLGAANGAASLDSTGSIPISQLGNLIDGAPETLDTLNELANSIGSLQEGVNDQLANIQSSVTDEISNAIDLALVNAEATANSLAISTVGTHDSNTTSIHGIANTALLATHEYVGNAVTTAETYASNAISDHNADTTNVHGISNTAVLATVMDVANTVSAHADLTTSVHGIANTAVLATIMEVSNAVSMHSDSTTSIHGIANTALLLTTAGGTVDDLTVTGNLIVNGTTTTVSSANLEVTDSLIYLASEQYSEDVVDIGVYGAYGNSATGANNHPHTGLVRDSSNGKWNLISGGSEPANNIVSFSGVTYDTLKLGGVEFSDGTQTKEGVPSRTPIITSNSSNYTLSSLSERDSLIELTSMADMVITIPTDSTLDFPVGTSIDVLLSGIGSGTIEGASGVTVNATPGLKLRTQWSSCTLFKRAANVWVVYGDLKA